MLCRITQSLVAHRTESVSVMDYEQTMVSCLCAASVYAEHENYQH